MPATKTPTPATTTTRGLIEMEIGGEKRTFKFGMNSLSAFSQLYSGKPGDFATQLGQDPAGAMRDLAYCGLLTRKADNNLPEDFSPETVGDWIDEMPQADWNAVQTVMLGALTVGNPQAPSKA